MLRAEHCGAALSSKASIANFPKKIMRVLRIIQVRNSLYYLILSIPNKRITALRNKRIRLPAFPGAAGATDAVNIIFPRIRLVKVDDVAHVWNIKSARRDVGRD